MKVMQEQYKDTKIGRIPTHWEVVKLEDVLDDFQNGYAFSSKGYVKEGIPIVSMAYIGLKGQFSFNYEKANYWSSESKSELSRYLLHKDDLLIAMTDVTPSKNLIGRMVLINIDDEFLLNQRVGLLKTNNRVSKQFLMYIGNSKVWRSYSIGYSTLGVQTNLGTKEIRKGQIPLPPLPEQQKIAEILSTVDEQISITQAIIDKSKELKKGLMQKLFSEGIGHTKFKDTKIGRIPKDWEVVLMKSICDIKGGYSFKSNLFQSEGNYQVLRIGNLYGGSLDVDRSPVFIDVMEKQFEDFLLKENDLISTMTGTVGKRDFGFIVKIDKQENLLLNQRVCKMRATEIDSSFLYYTCSTTNYLNQFFLQATGGTGNQANIGITHIGEIKVALPSLDEQQKIADILSEVDTKIEKEEQEKAYLEQLKKGLMQQLLTGKKRVIV